MKIFIILLEVKCLMKRYFQIFSFLWYKVSIFLVIRETVVLFIKVEIVLIGGICWFWNTTVTANHITLSMVVKVFCYKLHIMFIFKPLSTVNNSCHSSLYLVRQLNVKHRSIPFILISRRLLTRFIVKYF